MMEDYELTPEAAESAASFSYAYNWDQCPLITSPDPPWEWDWLWDLIRDNVISAVRTVVGWVTRVYEDIKDWVGYYAKVVTGWVTGVYEDIKDYVISVAQATVRWVYEAKEAVWDYVILVAKNIVSWVLEAWETARVGIQFAIDFGIKALSTAIDNIAGSITSLLEDVTKGFAGIPDVITSTLADPITDWFTGLIETLVSMPFNVLSLFIPALLHLPISLLVNFRMEIVHGIVTAFEWVGRWAEGAATNILEAIIGYVQQVGRIDPTNAPTVAGGLMSLVGAGVFGLAAMTLAGELMHPLKEIGMGNISAMIGDVVNYRVVSGAFMAALVGAALTTPLRYYFNYLVRPWLPDRRVMDMSMSRSLFEHPETLVDPDLVEPIKALVGPDARGFERRMLGYHGFADEWYPVYKELANTTIGYFALAAVARSGVFDPQWFWESLQRAGYSIRVRQHLYDMYEAESRAEIKALYVGEPISAFKEGWFTEERLKRELTELGVPEKAHPRYVHAAWLKYEVDLLSDRLAGLKEAYRKGLVTDADFQNSLTGWGMAIERAIEHLTREQIRRYGKL